MENAADAGADMVTVMTLHGAKGLEFDNVFLAGWEEGLFPSQRAIDEGGNQALEEERRLAYVGLTRARRRCTVSFAANRRVYGQWSSSIPSRFVEELPRAHIEHLERNPAMRPDLDPVLDQGLFGTFPARFRSRRAALDKLIEGKAEILSTRPPGKPGGYAVGERIFHDKFGYGRIEAIDGNKLEIAFDKAGHKKVVDSFVQPA
jgi:DNA helicase-2/ATP-dependent DNA helicase PcrA